MQIVGARGLSWRARKSGDCIALWVARRDIVVAGFRPKSQIIWRGKESAIDDSVRGYIRDACNKLQDEMLLFASGGMKAPGSFDGTIGSLVDIYQTDPYSKYRGLRYASRKRYAQGLLRLKNSVGTRRLGQITYKDLTAWYEKCRWPEGKEGRDQVYAATNFIALVRIIVNFGVVAEVYKPNEINHCVRLSQILSHMEFEGGRPRSLHLDRTMATEIITEAPQHGRSSIALGQAMQFELNVRQKDVIGEWVPLEEPGTSEYLYRGKKWICGFDWRNVSQDLILTHTLSKSMRGKDGVRAQRGKEMKWDLKLYPLIMAEITKIPVEERHGAMVKDEKAGRPWLSDHYRHTWREIARAAGVPDAVKNMDSRAGGITETLDVTEGNLELARKGAGHESSSMTQRYSRDVLAATSKVAILRGKLGRNK